MDIKARLGEIFSDLYTRDKDDAILECPANVLSLLFQQPESVIELARSKLESYKFDRVPLAWRRLFTDASIYKALRILEDKIVTPKFGSGSVGKSEQAQLEPYLIAQVPEDGKETYWRDDWHVELEANIRSITECLDMAMIMTAAPSRASMINDIFTIMQVLLATCDCEKDHLNGVDGGALKSAEHVDHFPTAQAHALPHIQYPVTRARCPSLQEFERHVCNERQPLVITDAISHWPAMDSRPWRSPRYLLSQTLGGRRLVPIEIGRSYTDDDWGQAIVPFGHFLETYMLKNPRRRTNSSPSREQCDRNHSLSHEPGCASKIAYLAQYDLFSQIPSLRHDIAIPDYCWISTPSTGISPMASKGVEGQEEDTEPLLNLWIGPAGTVSPLHTDPYHNMFCQVLGKKYIRLYSPQETVNLYPRGLEGVGAGVDMSNTSSVDIDADQAELDRNFPSFKNAKYLETCLEEGESLYIPAGWWHCVKSCAASISISFWWN